MGSTSLPLRLLTAQAHVYLETDVQGAMGEPQQKIHPIFSKPCRADHKETRRQTGERHESPKIFKVYMNGGADLTAKHWIRVTFPDGQEIIGQVVLNKNPSTLSHHTETTIECRTPPPEESP